MRSIFLSAGHSLTDPGAVGTTLDATGKSVPLKEADVAVEIRNIVAFYLNELGIPYEVDGKGTANIPLKEAIVRARKHPIGIEFHCNASSTATATGVETLQGTSNTNLGAKICDAIADALLIRNRGAKPENSGQHHRLGFVQAGGIIVELFFISNPSDVASYQARKWILGKAIAETLAKAARN
jgi:N-acetylmuramoyl-L-alanine amidase